MEFLTHLSAWHWLSFAVVALILELGSGSIYLLWISFAAAMTALFLWLFPFSWQGQLLLFTLLSLISTLAWYFYDKKRDKTPTRPNLNKRAHQYIGRTFQLSQAIENGIGKIKVGDTTWRVLGDDAPLDSTVKVIDVSGADFIVKTIGEE